MAAKTTEICPHCESTSLYEAKVSARGYLGPDLLPGLGGGIGQSAKFRVVVCSECGATQFFADEKSRSRLAKLGMGGTWKRL